MKKNISILLLISIIVSVIVPVKAFAWSQNHVTRQCFVMDGETMYSDTISGLVTADFYTKGIMYALPASELVIELKDDLASGSSVRLELGNAEWFFRDTKNGIEEYYNNGGGIETQIPITYDDTKGAYTASTDKSGIYTRLAAAGEVEYQLVVSTDGKSAALVTKKDAIAGEIIRVPLITRLLKYGDATVSIESITNIAGTMHIFALVDAEINEKKEDPRKTAASVDIPATGDKEMPINKLIIEERRTGAIFSGTLEITAPKGVQILPDAELVGPLTQTSLNVDKDGKKAINIELTNELKWTEGTKGEGIGVNGEDYKLRYRFPAGVVNSSSLLIELIGIEKTKRDDMGKMIITGLKLVADETVPLGDIKLSIKNYEKTDFEEESFVAGKKVALIGEDKPDLILNPDIEHFDWQDLVKLEEFKAKSYISAINGNVAPDEKVSREQVCMMLYNLFADKSRNYISNFYDVSGESQNAVAFCYAKGFVTGYGTGEFKPNQPITRGEMATILNNILKLEAMEELPMLEKGHWSYETMAKLYTAGIITGYPDNTLRPDNMVTLAEAVTMINKAFDRGGQYRDGANSYSGLPQSHWAYDVMMNALHGFRQ